MTDPRDHEIAKLRIVAEAFAGLAVQLTQEKIALQEEIDALTAALAEARRDQQNLATTRAANILRLVNSVGSGDRAN